MHQGCQGAAQFIGGGRGGLQYAVPAQHIGDTQASRVRHNCLHFLVPAGQLQQKIAIQCRAVLRIACGVVDPAFDLAALQLCGDHLAQRTFKAAQFIRHTQLNIKVAVVDGAQLQRQGSAGEIRAGIGITGHA